MSETEFNTFKRDFEFKLNRWKKNIWLQKKDFIKDDKLDFFDKNPPLVKVIDILK